MSNDSTLDVNDYIDGIRQNPDPDGLAQFCLNLEKNGCNKCPLYKPKHLITARGGVDSRIMIIGQNPGAEEVEKGLPFVGPSGKMLDSHIEQSGLKEYNPYITNILLCYTENNRIPTADELAVCRIHFEQQVRLLMPDIILAVGLPAFKGVIPHMDNSKTTAKSLVGQVIKYREGGNISLDIDVMYLYHPSFIMRNGDREGTGVIAQKNIKTMKKAVDILKSTADSSNKQYPF